MYLNIFYFIKYINLWEGGEGGLLYFRLAVIVLMLQGVSSFCERDYWGLGEGSSE